ncbi:hypothetical protein E2542_SST17916 [Spatholobus suberectus]|nr:hypothetical protein E2542_SST17916 [Spatholobus suberectus]
MDPCPFVRLIVESLALKLPSPTRPPPLSGVHPSTTPCFCKIRINTFPSHTALLPLSSSTAAPDTTTSAPAFHLDPAALRRLSGKPLALALSVYNGPMGRTCGVRGAKLLGRLHLTLHLSTALSRSNTFHNGWLNLGQPRDNKPSAQLHLVVRSEPDPRFVFQFGGEPECSPVVFQIQGNIRQPVFSCKFSADRNYRSRGAAKFSFSCVVFRWLDDNSSFRNGHGRHSFDVRIVSSIRFYKQSKWVEKVLRRGQRASRQGQKGLDDNDPRPLRVARCRSLHGDTICPFPGSDRVSRSNPGAWLILRPNGASVSSWKPWGRLEAWRERGPVDGLGYKVELFSDNGPVNGIPIAEGTMSVKKGGHFCIDYKVMKDAGLGSRLPGEGFVMGSTVDGEGKVSKPVVQVGRTACHVHG